MEVEQYVMAYNADWEKIKRLLPKEFSSLRPVLRINVELLPAFNRVEFNTPVEYQGQKGWLNLLTWENGKEIDIQGSKNGKKTTIAAKYYDRDFLNIEFTGVGKIGGCPKENDNQGTFYLEKFLEEDSFISKFVTVEAIDEKKEYCNCDFSWTNCVSDESEAFYKIMDKISSIKCQEILGAYVVMFTR